MLDNKKVGTVLALGYFDSVHLGHQKVIKTAEELAKKLSAKLVIVTFGGNLKAVLFGEKEKVVYTDSEREKLYLSLGADQVYFAPITSEFLGMESQEFLKHLNDKFDVKGYVCGQDYRFGKNGTGCAEDVKFYAKENGQEAIIIPLKLCGDKKISSTEIKRLISIGDVKGANAMLGRFYSVSGIVQEDRKIGTKMGFPTTNVRLNRDKERLPDGVYAGGVEFDNKRYKAIVNYGARPTFNLEDKLVEAHILDFNGNLYGKEIKVFFHSFIRDVMKFSSVEQLVKQIGKDLITVREIDYD
ncbi:MAG: riboflavin biosynthesis protein RibF [Clostridia bacterium]|nr:riboflavin biosynthesis protein RibF [Clostridia bacterium]